MSFIEKLKTASTQADSLVCVGLDTDEAKLPKCLAGSSTAFVDFNRAVIDSTHDLACSYKPNSAFYEALGSRGIDMLIETCAAVPDNVPVILDVKRGDIGNTANKYADYAYDVIGADAVTVNPYMGFDAVKPFLRPGKCVFVLCLTSNPSANDFQLEKDGESGLYLNIARKAKEWSQDGEIGLVAGATRPENMSSIRDIVGDMPLLIPGIGAQGGDIEAVLRHAGTAPGQNVINSSRGILYASDGEDYASAARQSLLDLRNAINAGRESL